MTTREKYESMTNEELAEFWVPYEIGMLFPPNPTKRIDSILAARVPSLEAWEPDNEEIAYVIESTGDTGGDEYYRDDELHARARDFGNLWPTHEAAKAQAARVRVLNRVMQMFEVVGIPRFSPRGVWCALRSEIARNDRQEKLERIEAQLEKEGVI